MTKLTVKSEPKASSSDKERTKYLRKAKRVCRSSGMKGAEQFISHLPPNSPFLASINSLIFAEEKRIQARKERKARRANNPDVLRRRRAMFLRRLEERLALSIQKLSRINLINASITAANTDPNLEVKQALIPTTDLEASIREYREILGIK